MPTVDDLPGRFDGDVLTAGAPGYDEARTIWNGAIDHRPKYVVRCAGVPDVQAAVRAARDLDLTLGVRGGGHSAAGYAVPDGGLQIDLSRMSRVAVDPSARRATVEGGALLGALDAAAQEHGLATTAGIVSHTGVGGLTLGGGVGWLARQLGMTCDNVVGFDVVTAGGDVVRATAEENPDLFWALRGGGGNFGVVTRFELALHEVGTRAVSAEIDLDPADAADTLRLWAEIAVGAPRAASYYAELVGHVLTLGVVWVGPPEGARPAIDALDAFGPALDRREVELSYLDLQRRHDSPTAHGFRRYMKTHLLPSLPDGAIEAFLAHAGDHGVAASLSSYGGAIADMPADATAFPHRNVQFEYDASARWTDAADDAAVMAEARRLAATLDPYGSGAYVNAMPDEGERGVRLSYGERTYERLRRTKGRWDPDNVFQLNQNVPPLV